MPNLQTELKYLDLFQTYWIFTDLMGSPPLGWVSVHGVGEGNPHMHVCTHRCMLNMINMDASIEVAICNFYTCIFQCYTCVWMCVCMCACMWGHVGTPPRHTHTPLHRQELGSPQITKCATKLEGIEIIQFCLKIWDLYTFLHSYRLGLVCRWGDAPS